MAALRLHWLGPPSVEYDGRPLRLEMRKTLALLAYISLSPQAPTRETLASMFWPEYDQQHSLANLRRHLSSLARSLPAGVLDSDRERVGLSRNEQLEIDVQQFRALLADGSKHSLPDDGFTALEKAAALYKGDFFAGFNLKDCPEFDDWQLFQREEMRAEYAKALEKLAAGFRHREDWEKALGYARSWLALDHLHEPAQRMLMNLYFLSGDKSAALRQYEECQRVMQQELGQPPEPETEKLYKEIRSTPAEPLHPKSENLAATPDALLTRTKFFLPKIPRTILRRPRLVFRLNRCVELPLTLISASAGFGKTTLLAEWADQSHDIIAWVSLDRSDSDVYRMLDYILTAIRNVLPNSKVGAVASGLLHSSQTVDISVIVGSLINDLISIPHRLILVLDDYHNIDSLAAHDAVNFLLEHRPDNLHLVISTRTDPPLSLSRLRASLQLGDIRTDDLRFTNEETKMFLTQAIGFPLSAQDIVFFENKVEGWIAGIQMAALVMQSATLSQSSSELHSFIRAFKGSQRHILDYLIEEVLNRQPEDIRTFLLQTSILDKLSFSLCDDLLTDDHQPLPVSESPGRKSSQQILEFLERSNLFLIPLDDERKWYRYHHLFADLLHVRLQQHEPRLEAVLHRRAANWYARNGYPLEAVRHALDSGDFSFAADLIEEFSLNLIWMNQIVTTLDWFKSLPAEVVESHPLLNIYQTFVLARRGEFERVEAILARAETSIATMPPSAKIDEYKILIFGMRAFMANLQGDPEKAIVYSKDFSLVPKRRLDAGYFMARVQLAIASLDNGDLSTAERIFTEVVQWAQANQDVYYAVLTNKELAEIWNIRGRPGQAEKLHREMYDWIHQTVSEPGMYDGLIKVHQASLLVERNDLETACLLLGADIESILITWWSSSLYVGYMVMAYLHTALKDFPHARAAVEKAVNLVSTQRLYPRYISMVKACQVNLWLSEGNLTEARGWAQLQFPQIPTILPVVRELDHISLARVWMASGQWGEALDLLERLANSASAGGRFGRLLKIDSLRAVTLQQSGRPEEALALLDHCLAQACPEGVMRVFLDAGDPMKALIQQAVTRNRIQDPTVITFASRLLDAF